MTEIGYVMITPYSLHKSRTGGIIGRVLSLTDLEFICVRMYAPSDKMLDEYIQTLDKMEDAEARRLFVDYINTKMRKKNSMNISNRVAVLFFRGKNAVNILKNDVIGSISHEPKGDTVRGTYGDLIKYDNRVVYFEPAVLIATNSQMAREQIEIFRKYATTDGGILKNVINYPPNVNVQTTLVMLKPDNFQKKSAKPGNIIDMFSKTGLFIIGMKLIQMSVKQAEEFYKPLKEIFKRKLAFKIENKIKEYLLPNLPYKVSEEKIAKIVDLLREENAIYEFNQIIKYITGKNPEEISPQEYEQKGTEKCLVLLYQGENAIEKIRQKLGATDPTKAEGGTVRSDYGYNIMVNVAHASDSIENAERERKIVGMWDFQENDLEEYLK